VNGSITLSSGADPGKEMEKLLKLPGFGPWTVQYLAMRALGWPDAFPDTDLGVKKALSRLPAQEALTLPQTWSPWRSYATITLWNSLSRPKGEEMCQP
jgi:AraC family transcriptional regulator of adaptative response / DNA-3-methyladenine glycosylase II